MSGSLVIVGEGQLSAVHDLTAEALKQPVPFGVTINVTDLPEGTLETGYEVVVCPLTV